MRESLSKVCIYNVHKAVSEAGREGSVKSISPILFTFYSLRGFLMGD